MRTLRNIVIGIVVVFVVIMGIVIALAVRHGSPEQEAKRAEEQVQAERFTAAFDSLWHADVLPVIEETGIFSAWELSPNRTALRLTIESNDWYVTNTGLKKDLVGGLWAGLKVTLSESGGDPDDAKVTILDKWGERLAVANGYDGVKILK